MWVTLIKGLAFKAAGALKSPLVWIALLAVLCAFLARGWQGSREDVKAADAACQEAAEAATQAALAKQAEAWSSIYTAQQEAVARMAQEAGVAAATAREWKRRYEAARKTPACAQWAAEVVQCPVE
jgi:type II secretory pathway pseudopilin PulG